MSQDAGPGTAVIGLNSSGQFDPNAYLASRPDLTANYNSDPGYAQLYGSIQNYALADATANGAPAVQQAIQAGQINVPQGMILGSPNAQGVPQLASASSVALNASGTPLEQALLQQTLPSVESQIGQTANYTTEANNLLAQNQAAYTNLGNVLAQGAEVPDVNTFFSQNPAAASAFAATGGVVPGQNNGQAMTAAQFAQYYATANNLQLPVTSPLQQQQDSAVNTAVGTATGAVNAATGTESGAATTAAAQQTAAAQANANSNLTSLSQAVASMQGSLTGELGAQAAALAQNLQTLQSNIGTFGSAESQALTTQINQQLQDLQTAISQQQSALQTQAQTLQGATDSESQQQLASVNTELQSLNAAEAPVAAATTAAAQAQVTAVNIGLAQQNNQIQAQSALQGFVGGSTMTNNAEENAAIAAQQQGAADVGQANVTNAENYQAIADQGAQQSNAIQQAIAGQTYTNTANTAAGQDALANALAQGQQNLNDTGAAGQAAIQAAVAGQQESASNTDANTAYANTVAGLQAQNTLANQLAEGTANIQSTEAGQNQTIANTAAQQQQQATDTGATNLLGVQETGAAQTESNALNAYNQSLQSALGAASIPANEATAIPGLANVANTGTNNALSTLNWWASPATASTPGALATTPATTGTALSTLGSGLLGSAITAGNANNWWQSPAANTAQTSLNNTTAAANASIPNGSNLLINDASDPGQ